MTQSDAINLVYHAMTGVRSKNIDFFIVVLSFWPRLYYRMLIAPNETKNSNIVKRSGIFTGVGLRLLGLQYII